MVKDAAFSPVALVPFYCICGMSWCTTDTGFLYWHMANTHYLVLLPLETKHLVCVHVCIVICLIFLVRWCWVILRSIAAATNQSTSPSLMFSSEICAKVSLDVGFFFSFTGRNVELVWLVCVQDPVWSWRRTNAGRRWKFLPTTIELTNWQTRTQRRTGNRTAALAHTSSISTCIKVWSSGKWTLSSCGHLVGRDYLWLM